MHALGLADDEAFEMVQHMQPVSVVQYNIAVLAFTAGSTEDGVRAERSIAVVNALLQ